MPVLGKAIARHLLELSGLYSVELPGTLLDEMCEIVVTCNQDSANRAVLVGEDPPPLSGVKSITWAEILGWRTDDDRVFVWRRGIREPDTSFQSVVKPFISSRFPGQPGGECNLGLLSAMSIRELWRKNGLAPSGDAFDAYKQTASWVAGVLYYAFEQHGSNASLHWSDEFLNHWAGMLKTLDEGLANWTRSDQSLHPRHAWEVVRASGLPVPAAIAEAGNPFQQAPKELLEVQWEKFARFWKDVVDKYLLAEGGMDVLLTSLDQSTKGEECKSSWRDLPWHSLPKEGAAAPIIGKKVFVSSASPSLVSPTVPSYPVAPKPSWWGVTETELQDAISLLQRTRIFQPSISCPSLPRALPGHENTYVLLTRHGEIGYKHAAHKWNAKVSVRGLQVALNQGWQGVFISYLAPKEGQPGYIWINPDNLELKATGGGLSIDVQQVFAIGNQVLVNFDLNVEYGGGLDGLTRVASGSWNPLRNLQINVKVQDYGASGWGVPRPVTSSFRLIVPSPFTPTVMIEVSKSKVAIAPDAGNRFAAPIDVTGTWKADSTPDILLDEDGVYDVTIYDGCVSPRLPEFLPASQPVDSPSLTTPPSADGLFASKVSLDEGDVVSVLRQDHVEEVAVVKIKERSSGLSSGLVSVVAGLPAGRKPPSSRARNGFLGQYQTQVTRALCGTRAVGYNSLFQYVVSSVEDLVSWLPHPGTPAPQYLLNLRPGISLPGIGHGPSDVLTKCTEWKAFMDALSGVCQALGLVPGAEETWLTGFDPSNIPAQVVRAYATAHRDLVARAKTYTPADAFWASYPFSVLVVDGQEGPSFGQLQAVLLSPLHSARLAWAFALAFAAKEGRVGRSLLGLAEGWNIPYTGSVPTIAGQNIPLVAIPIDPGEEKDFISWSALAVLTNTGLTKLPPSAVGQSLPWGGRTGINQKVVERAIKDYLAVHPHINSLEIDIRALTTAPRSQEIDQAALQLIGTDEIEEVGRLGGATRVWDSLNRLGIPPNRDDLSKARAESEHFAPFEWRRYESRETVENADVAFIEDSSVHLAITPGTTYGLTGPLPLKRFCPASITNLMMDQNYAVRPQDDLLGLTAVLAEIEHSAGSLQPALRATPQAHALGVGLGARWEVLGTFNIDPALLSSVVASQAQASGQRLLWEWRPSWLGKGSGSDELGRRPYYVVGKIPPSLLAALEYRQGLTRQQASEMLFDLGRRGIGLTSLHAAGGTQESAAAGFFYALRLLLPSLRDGFRAAWTERSDGDLVCSILPVDPIQSILEEMTGPQPTTVKRRADLLAVSIERRDGGSTRVCFVPVEVKCHGREGTPEPLPDNADTELRRARDQLADTATLVCQIAQSIHAAGNERTGALNAYVRRLGLASLLELAMSFAPDSPPAAQREAVLRDVLEGQITIGVGQPILLWFAPGSMTLSGQACIVDLHSASAKDISRPREVFIDPAATRGLWWSKEPVGPDAELTRRLVDQVMLDSLARCTSATIEEFHESRSELVQLLALGVAPGPATAPQAPDGGREAQIGALDPDVRETDGQQADVLQGREESQKEKQIPPEDAIRSTEEDEDGIPSATSSEPPVRKVEVSELVQPREVVVLQPPRAFLGWTAHTSRWTILGTLAASPELVALDLDHPKAVGIFGYMGSGKSYLLGTIIEAALIQIPGINALEVPLASVIFNYRRNASDRFELSSLALPNQNPRDIESLAHQYHATHMGVTDGHVLCLPGELTPERRQEYGPLSASELFFNPDTLTVEDWELLMGEPGSTAVFARTIRHALMDLRSSGRITLEALEHSALNLLGRQSRTAAELRFDFIRRYLSSEHGIDFDDVIRPGRAVIVDLRQPLFNRDDALRFFLVCANQVSRIQGRFNKLVVFDEAHEYMSEAFGERIESRIRQMRHEGTSYIFATQDVGSIPLSIRRFVTTRFVFTLGTRQNVEDLVKFAPEFRECSMLGLQPGSCLVQANDSIGNLFERPRLVRIRPRVTAHGGETRIYSTGSAAI